MKKQYLFLLFILGNIQLLIAQIGIHGQCGYIQPPSEIDRLLKNKKDSQQFNLPEGTPQFIPIQFHLVGNDSGSGHINEATVLASLCQLNQNFIGTDLQFYFSGTFNYINNSKLFDLDFPNVPTEAKELYRTHKVTRAINIFIGNGLSSGNSGYYASSYDVIYMDKSYVNGHDVILAHEMGHFFGLAHTFFGWGETNYNPNEPTPTTVDYFGNSYNVEYVDRSNNCENSGDFLCGTPADYIKNWGGACDYTGGAVDPDMVLLNPDEENFMGYFLFKDCQEYHFSDDQIDLINADYFNRPELIGDSPSNFTMVTDTSELIAPIENELVGFYNEVSFDWVGIDNATNYIIEISRLSDFLFIEETANVEETQYTATALTKDKKYYWRVWAFNKANACGTKIYSSTETFETGIKNIDEFFSNSSGIILSPNPVSQNNSSVDLWLKNAVNDISFQVFNAKGQLVFQKEMNLRRGQNIVLGENEMILPQGIYFLNFKNEKFFHSEKMVVY